MKLGFGLSRGLRTAVSMAMLLLGLLVGLQTLTACLGPSGAFGNSTAPETPINRIERGLLDATDLPFGWRRESTGVPQDLPGGLIARYRDYRGPGNTPIFVRAGQSIALYASEAESDAAYQATASEMIPAAYVDKWSKPSELDLATQADAIVIGCHASVINGISARTCVVVAQYGKFVTTLDGQVFDDRWLTMAQFRKLLERVDAKMAAIRELQENGAPTPVP